MYSKFGWVSPMVKVHSCPETTRVCQNMIPGSASFR
jgi:hypothetical protein